MRPNDFPALMGNVVTEAHTRICVEHGHASHDVDGVISDLCPRCGEARQPAPVQARIRAEGHLTYEGTVIVDDASGVIMQRTALILPDGKRRVHPKPVTIEIKRQYIISQESI